MRELTVDTPDVEINAPPEKVREIALDFANMPKWHTGHFEYIKVTKPENRDPKDLVEGDRLAVSVHMGNKFMEFKPKILVNTPKEFRWQGEFPIFGKWAFSGVHIFRFEPLENGKTRFEHSEIFEGLGAKTMIPSDDMAGKKGKAPESGKQNKAGFLKYNADLKKRCEEM